jgi:NADPH:quinone reductase-like Zn-dependent oxidoreductase
MVGTGSPAKDAMTLEQGAEAVAHTQDQETYNNALRSAAPDGYDVILERTGGKQLRVSLRLLKANGRLIGYGVSNRQDKNGRRKGRFDLDTIANILLVLGAGRLRGK